MDGLTSSKHAPMALDSEGAHGQNGFANATKHSWIPGEDVTFVLQEDFNATFFFVEDNPGKGIDPVRAFLLRAEKNVRSLFHHLLYRPGCAEREQEDPWGAGCVTTTDNRQQIVLDVGSNRGWYSLVSASYGHRVYCFDPQPHCRTLLSSEIVMNGYSDLITFTHAFVTDIPNFSMDVMMRTGCMGGFPNNNEQGYADRFRKPLDRLEGANKTMAVGSVVLDDMFDGSKHDILLLKMDVEGHEIHALATAKKLLEKRAIRNIIIEFNIPMMGRQKEGLVEMKRLVLNLIKSLMNEYGFKAKSSHKGDWRRQSVMKVEEWDRLFTTSFLTVDAWFFQ